MHPNELKDLSNEELWQLFPIIISDYREEWKEQYIHEQEIILLTVGEESIERIQHIGSTSVPDLVAKPTIDILLEIKKETEVNLFIEKLENIGYIHSPQPNNPPPHLMFMKGYTPQGFQGQTYHLHIRYRGDWNEFYFRDYLINHPETAKEYTRLKLTLAKQYRNNRDAYTEAKTDFIRKYTEAGRKECLRKGITYK